MFSTAPRKCRMSRRISPTPSTFTAAASSPGSKPSAMSARGRNFLLTIRRLLSEKDELRVVSDQIGAPTSAGALANATAELLRGRNPTALGEARGTYHLTAAGHTSWHGFAVEIARL